MRALALLVLTLSGAAEGLKSNRNRRESSTAVPERSIDDMFGDNAGPLKEITRIQSADGNSRPIFSPPIPPGRFERQVFQDTACYKASWEKLRPGVPVHGNPLDHYMRFGLPEGLKWGCGNQTYGYGEFSAKDTGLANTGCRASGCCIYVLDMGLDSTAGALDIWTKHGSKEGGDPDPRDSQYAQEYHLHQGLKASKHRTVNVDEADAIWVASYDTYGCFAPMNRRFGGDGFDEGCVQQTANLEAIMGLDKFKNESARFVFTASHHYGWDYPKIYHKGTKLLVDHAITKKGESSVVIPYIPRRVGQAPVSANQHKTHKIFFMGNCRSKMRERLVSEFVSMQQPDIEVGADQCKTAPGIPEKYKTSTATYAAELANSEFCLVIPGDTPSSRRDLEVAIYGCIPLFVGRNKSVLPFTSHIPYQEFALFFDAKVSAELIYETVNAITPTQKAQMLKAMSEHLGKANLRSALGVETAASEMCGVIVEALRR